MRSGSIAGTYSTSPAFVALAEELHFGRASERLHLSQPALSQQIRRLEDQLGLRLFERDSRRVELTDTGVAMLDAARASMAALHQAEAAAYASVAGQPTLRLAIDVDVPERILAVVRDVARAATANARLLFGHYVDIADSLISERIDAALLWGHEDTEQLEGWHLIDEEIVAVFAADHPLAGRTSVTRDEFVSYPFVMFQPEYGEAIFEALLRLVTEGWRSVELVETVPLGSAQQAMLDAVDQDARVTQASCSFLLQQDRPHLSHARFEPTSSGAIELVARRTGRSPQVDELRHELQRRLRDLAD